MFDLGWTEMAVVALVALVIIGPKDLPGAMRTMAHWVRRVRMLARDFQSGLDDMMRETELDEAKKHISSARNFNVRDKVEKTLDPEGEVDKQARDLDKAARQEATSEPAEVKEKTAKAPTENPAADPKPADGDVAEDTTGKSEPAAEPSGEAEEEPQPGEKEEAKSQARETPPMSGAGILNAGQAKSETSET